MKRSPMPPRTSRLAPGAPPARRTRMKARSKNRPKELHRIYGPLARRLWVKSLPCAACGVVGYSENAHVLGNGGAGRKNDADTIAPLCATRFALVGCHELFDDYPWEFARRFPDFDPAAVAARVAQAWDGTR